MKKKVRKYIVIGAITVVLGILSFMMYQSYAYYKVNYTGNIINTTVGEFGVYDYAYTGNAQEFVVPVNGYYNIELWGASGGQTSENSSWQTANATDSKGGYTSGSIYLAKNETIYLYLGGAGHFMCEDYTLCAPPGFNGGSLGDRFTLPSYPARSFGGGGATDIRLVSGAWNDSASLRSRIMVAGAGASQHGVVLGAMDGGLIAENGHIGTLGTETIAGVGGSQISGGPITDANSGSFGIGGNSIHKYPNIPANNGASGGGAGYYGGSGGIGGAPTDELLGSTATGGGGSSYISGYAGVNSVQQTGGTAAQPLHTNNTIHYSDKYFINGKMEQGLNLGNGKAKITYVGSEIPVRTNTKLDNVRYVKFCQSSNQVNNSKGWVELQAIKDGINVAYGKTVTGTHTVFAGYPYSRITDGDLTLANYAMASNTTTVENTCVTVDLGQVYDLEELTLWSYYDGRIYNDNILSVGATNTSGTTPLSTVLHNYPGTTGYAETGQGKRYTAWD